MATAVAKAPAAGTDAPKKGKLLPIVILIVVLIAGGAGAAWFFLARGHADGEEEDTVAATKPSVFLPLDQFTVNLQAEDGQQFLQVAMTLKVADQPVADAIKAAMPEVRSRVLLLLSSKKAAQLSSVDGKNELATQVIHEVERTLPIEKKKAHKSADAKGTKARTEAGKGNGKSAQEEPAGDASPGRVLAVFFTHFIVQ